MKLIRFENCESEEEKAKLCILFLADYFKMEGIPNTFKLDNSKLEKKDELPW